METTDKDLMVREQNAGALSNQVNTPRGYDDEDDGDVIIPRVKLVQDLSPERKDKSADSGDIINSLTKEKLNGTPFIAVYKYNNNIEWKPRSEGGGMVCRSMDGKVGIMTDGTTKPCAICKRCEFDNGKVGKDAIPPCTKYINFLGFFEGTRIPIVLSFSKTYLAEGKKMYSMAKFTMMDMWMKKYIIESREMSKNGNDWYALNVKQVGATSAEDQAFAEELYNMFKGQELKVDLETGDDEIEEVPPSVNSSMASEI